MTNLDSVEYGSQVQKFQTLETIVLQYLEAKDAQIDMELDNVK